MVPKCSPSHHSLSITYEALSALKLDPRNPRKHSDKQVRQIAQSIESFGFNVPVLVDSERNVVAGHGRVQAVRLLGWDTIPTIKLEHLTAHQRAAFVIADNRLCENSSWDAKLLGEQLRTLSEVDIDFTLEVTGFETTEIDLLIDDCSFASDASTDPDDDLPLEQHAVSVYGDLWKLDEHRLLCGNSLQASSYETLLEDRQAKLVVADPPYNVKIHGHASGLGKIRHREFPMASGEMTPAAFTEFLKDAMTAAAAHSSAGSLAYIFMDWRHMSEVLTAGDKVYSGLLNLCVWSKTNPGMGSFYRSGHELIFVFRHGKESHRNNIQLGRFGRNRSNVWVYPNANTFSRTSSEGNLLELHPTVKPVALIADVIRDCTARGELVLDPFSGSGTCTIAAERTGRICYGIELDPQYVDTAVRRWQAFTKREAIHCGTGESFNKREEASKLATV